MLNKIFQVLSPRVVIALFFVATGISVLYALYAQFFQNASPCPLCIVERVTYMALALVSLVGLIHNPSGWGYRIYGLLLLIVCGFGIKVTAHHVWLQSLPMDEWPASCGMPLSVLFKQVPLTGFLHTVLSGSAECAKVDWLIFGVSAPKLVLASFILMAVGALYLIFRPKTH